MKYIKKNSELIVEATSPNLLKDYEKSLAALKKLDIKKKTLDSQISELRKENNNKYVSVLKAMGFQEKTIDDDTAYIFNILGGAKFSNGKFQFKKWDYSNTINLLYIDNDVRDNLLITDKLQNLKTVQKLIVLFKKDPLKGLAHFRNLLGDNEYSLKRFDRKIDELKNNFFTGRKSSKDVKMMHPKQIMAKFKIPNVTYRHIEGKRSRVFDDETHSLVNNLNFFNNFKNYYAKYGKPVKITTTKFDSREDDYDYEASRRGENEWSYSIGTKVILHFKDERNNTITLQG